jgi:hypothetical protein
MGHQQDDEARAERGEPAEARAHQERQTLLDSADSQHHQQHRNPGEGAHERGPGNGELTVSHLPLEAAGRTCSSAKARQSGGQE